MWYKLADDQLHFYHHDLARHYYGHPNFHRWFDEETQPAFVLLHDSHLVRHVRGEYYRTYELTDRGVDFGQRQQDVLMYVEHFLRMQEYWNTGV